MTPPATSSVPVALLLEKLLGSDALAPAETEALFAHMLSGEMPEAQIAAVLTAWRLRGEGAQELTIGARALRQHSTKVVLPAAVRPLVDNCGTGGDGSNSFNLSTTAAIVAASAGTHVAKHGNRSISSKCGSADLLFAAGLSDQLPATAAATLLEETGFTFFFAPSYHPILRHVGPVRRALGVRTIFNLLGPLANPIAPERQLVGVGAARYLEPMAEALAALGVERGLVVHSRDGLDELSPAAPTDARLIANGTVSPLVIDPTTLGVQATLKDLAGGDPQVNLGLLRLVLAGTDCGLADAVALNAGALLWLADTAPTLADGVALAKRQLHERHAERFFTDWLDRAHALHA